jgi:hypothetical protein
MCLGKAQSFDSGVLRRGFAASAEFEVNKTGLGVLNLHVSDRVATYQLSGRPLILCACDRCTSRPPLFGRVALPCEKPDLLCHVRVAARISVACWGVAASTL